ncbi:glycosyltransferase family 2 protein [Methanococcoides seepicolus]|uniref:Glycosyltransferase family 2 protein n=1 Tax=Methanococcoides seepicolus TaxID=2828780 RepID=A0A9E4ZFF7_9EURY|nr:glycosyltransferase [Methanococcoides seepicolus]MCM1986732.1 glycosyltransferase family 2 protein [Methanococcoides seepicolus]
MQVSVIIPTYKRVNDLSECLDSIFVQTKMPIEIIVIDNANDFETERYMECKANICGEAGINLKYIKNGDLNSATIARNIGAKKAIGDILLLLDDDVILDENFVEEILYVYKKHPNAIGVQGYITNRSLYNINSIRKLFFLTHSKKDTNKLLPSIQSIYADPLTKIINCEWLMSGCTCYKKDIVSEIKFDENMYKYCSGDDVDFSYRISQKYPRTLYQTPFAKLIHKVSDSGRAPKKEAIFTSHIYHTYLFYKNVDQILKNKLIFIWSKIGHLIIKCGEFILKPSMKNFWTIIYIIYAYAYCLKHIKSLKKGDLRSYTKLLLKGYN